MRHSIVIALIFLLIAGISALLYINSLTFKIQKTVWGKDCTVSVAVINGDKSWTYNNKKVPLMSVFKYFVAAIALKRIKILSLSLDDKILITPDIVSKTTYSPMLKKYTPPFKISVQDLMKYMISESDNNATDILIEYLGGIEELQSWLKHFRPIEVEVSANEKMMNENIKAQYLNTAKPLDVIGFMRLMREDNGYFSYALFAEMFDQGFLPDKDKKFLDKIMIETVTGEDKIKAGLPEGVVFGHKTGSSSRKPDGVKIADNDVGFVILPNGKTYYIAVFVTESKMSDKENADIIAQISEIVYKYFTAAK